jgi:Calx-beta domain
MVPADRGDCRPGIQGRKNRKVKERTVKKFNRTPAPFHTPIETLESRTLLSVSLLASKAGSELHPTTSGRGVFTVSRTGSKADALVVDYSVVSAGTTAAPADYASLADSVTIPAGKASTTIVINPVTDGSSAKQETLQLALAADSSYTINPKHASAVLKIAVPKTLAKVEDTVSITASVANASEASPSTITSGQYTVSRTGPLTSAVTVDYTIDSSSTAVAGTDYDALTGEVTIPAKQSMETITVTPIIKTTQGSATTVTVDLSPGAYFAESGSSQATVTIANNNTSGGGGGGGGGGTPSSDWFVSGDTYRTTIQVSSGSFARTDEPVSQSINFTQLLAEQGASGALSDGSIQVVETSSDGSTEVNSTVPVQFDHGSGYDATNNAAGTLTIEAAGNTAAGTTRYFQVYFNTTTTYTAPTVTPQVTVTQNVTDAAGNAAIKIQTQSATYYLEPADGGLADIIDNSGNDWVSYNNTVGAAGTYHGVPNGQFHPGDGSTETMTATVDSTGPLLATITCSNSGNSITYQFYANFVTATVNSEQTPYPFLYEGTPGGQFNTSDTWAISDGTTGTLANDMPEPDSDGNGGTGEIFGAGTNDGEWAYFDSASAGKFIYFAHDSGTQEIDSYFDLDDDMTVFGFGRSRISGAGGNYLYTTAPETFTFGIANDSGSFSTNAATIDGQYNPISATTGTLQTQSGS